MDRRLALCPLERARADRFQSVLPQTADFGCNQARCFDFDGLDLTQLLLLLLDPRCDNFGKKRR
jgi:hypothetical protein